MRATMRRNANNPSHARGVDLERNDAKGKPPHSHDKLGGGGGGRGGRRRSCCKMACGLLCVSLVFGLLAAAVKTKPLWDSYGYEMPYFLVVPLWVRWVRVDTTHSHSHSQQPSR